MAKQKGFTLIEVMIVVAIIAILAAVAYPSYQDHIRKSHRADAQAALMELGAFMERNFTLSGRYDKDSAGTDVTLPFTQTPREGTTTKYYDLELSDVDTTSYELTATPISGTDQVNDPCGTLTLDSTGARTASGDVATGCWK